VDEWKPHVHCMAERERCSRDTLGGFSDEMAPVDVRSGRVERWKPLLIGVGHERRIRQRLPTVRD